MEGYLLEHIAVVPKCVANKNIIIHGPDLRPWDKTPRGPNGNNLVQCPGNPLAELVGGRQCKLRPDVVLLLCESPIFVDLPPSRTLDPALYTKAIDDTICEVAGNLPGAAADNNSITVPKDSLPIYEATGVRVKAEVAAIFVLERPLCVGAVYPPVLHGLVKFSIVPPPQPLEPAVSGLVRRSSPIGNGFLGRVVVPAEDRIEGQCLDLPSRSVPGPAKDGGEG
mmetsp:Transcript_29025/g.38543  ORF Transcript_29025/g.38543 Transcript_29025/m.38543 type:complete len:224 (-) Transcript_29025:1363-2034(-)